MHCAEAAYASPKCACPPASKAAGLLLAQAAISRDHRLIATAESSGLMGNRSARRIATARPAAAVCAHTVGGSAGLGCRSARE